MSSRAGLDKAVIVEAAVQLVDEEGIEALTLGRLAERLGVRTPSLYNHISGFLGLKQELAIYCLQELLDRVTSATIGKARAEAIRAFAAAYRTYARTYPGRYALTLKGPDPDTLLQAISTRVLAVIQAILAPYHLSEEDNIHAIRSLRSVVHGFVTLDMASGFRMSVDRDASFDWLITLYIDGLERNS